MVAVGWNRMKSLICWCDHGVQVPLARRNATIAFRNVCVHCAAHLSNVSLVESLMDAAESALPALSLEKAPAVAPGSTGELAFEHLEERTALIQGLGRLVAALPGGATPAVTEKLILPVVTRGRHWAQCGGQVSKGDPSQLGFDLAVSAQLKLLAAAVSVFAIDDATSELPASSIAAIWPAEKLEANQEPHAMASGSQYPPSVGPGDDHPCMTLLKLAFPLLSDILASPNLRADSNIMEALCQLYQNCLGGIKRSALTDLPRLESVLQVFEEQLHWSCLAVIGKAVEVCCQDKHDADVSLFAAALDSSSAIVLALVQVRLRKMYCHRLQISDCPS